MMGNFARFIDSRIIVAKFLAFHSLLSLKLLFDGDLFCFGEIISLQTFKHFDNMQRHVSSLTKNCYSILLFEAAIMGIRLHSSYSKGLMVRCWFQLYFKCQISTAIPVTLMARDGAK